MGIYVFRVKTELENDLIKVGHTNHSRSRMSHIRSALKNYPWFKDLSIVGSRPGASLEEEQTLHRSQVANENRAPKMIFQGQDLGPDLTEYYWFNDTVAEWLLTFMTDEDHFNDNSDEFVKLIKEIEETWGVNSQDIAKAVNASNTCVQRWRNKSTLPRAREAELLYKIRREGLTKLNGNALNSEGHRIWMSDDLAKSIQSPEAKVAVAELIRLINEKFRMQITLAAEYKFDVPLRPRSKYSFGESPQVQEAM